MDGRKGITIAVMGATGTGKSTFINLISNSNLLVSNSLKSVTANVGLSQQFYLDGLPVTLIDTPGFDDTTMSDTEILTKISSYLSVSYEFGYRLSGVIYLHRISDQRMTGSSLKNYLMFKKLCGERGMKNVAIVTNMWGKVPNDIAEGRELQLRSEDLFFKGDIANGAHMLRHDGTLPSAQKVIRHFIRLPLATLEIQHELVTLNKDITETDACAILDEGLDKLREKSREEVQAFKDEIEEALQDGDPKQEELRSAIRSLEDKLAEMDQIRREMSKGFTIERKRAKGLIKELIRRGSEDKGKGRGRAKAPSQKAWALDEAEWKEMRSRIREHAAEINNIKRQVQSSKGGRIAFTESMGDDDRRDEDTGTSEIGVYALIFVVFLIILARVAASL